MIAFILLRDKSLLQSSPRNKEKCCGIDYKNSRIGKNAKLHDGR